MSHGFIDDIPAHTEFWRRFKSGQNYVGWREKTKVRYGLLKRLLRWKLNIRKLRKIRPDYSLRELERWLIEIEVQGVGRNIMGKEEK